MLDLIDYFIDDGTSCSVDPLLSTTACECSEERLLAPDGFFPSALVADMVAHRGEQRVGLVVTPSKAEQKRSEDPEGHHC